MHDSVGLQLGTSLQSAKLQLANLLQNCYFCLIQKTISNSILWSLVIKHFWPGCFPPPYLLRPGATAPLCPLPSVTPLPYPFHGLRPLGFPPSPTTMPLPVFRQSVRLSACSRYAYGKTRHAVYAVFARAL